jgi:broad specificity phosphatase PhoE
MLTSHAGETEWTLSGRYTGTSDILLTAHGESQVLATSTSIVGAGRIIDPCRMARIYISPRTRAKRTYELLFTAASRASFEEASKVEITDDIKEWVYGDYEGLLTAEIRAGRKSRGLDEERDWDIWKDGCEGGESAQEISDRLDALIRRIRAIQAPHMKSGVPVDVMIVAHGHSLRAFAKRWVGFPLGTRLPMMLEPGAVGVCSYEHHRVDEPALLLGINMGGGGEAK